MTGKGLAILQIVPSLLQDRFRRELLKLQEWEQMLATLQRIASMMDAEEIVAAPVLAAGAATAAPEDVSQFLEKAVAPDEGEVALSSPEGETVMSSIDAE